MPPAACLRATRRGTHRPDTYANTRATNGSHQSETYCKRGQMKRSNDQCSPPTEGGVQTMMPNRIYHHKNQNAEVKCQNLRHVGMREQKHDPRHCRSENCQCGHEHQPLVKFRS